MNESTSRLTDYNWSRNLLKLVAIFAMTVDNASTVLLAEGTAIYNIVSSSETSRLPSCASSSSKGSVIHDLC